ncbi:MAG: response regulator transcription factor [Verrucomicrobiota bacterium]
MQVLLIEDDVDLSTTIAEYLSARGVESDHAYDGLSGLHLATTSTPDAIILDIGLPGISGLELCQKLRKDAKADLPIIMLTARDTIEDKVEGLSTGADDYLVKPFALAELHARLQALVRRSQGITTRQIEVADLLLDLDVRSAKRDGKPLDLSRLEFDLLATLCAMSPEAINKEELARRVWHETFVEDETIRTHIYQLRQKVDKPFSHPLIHTIRGYGHAVQARHA